MHKICFLKLSIYIHKFVQSRSECSRITHLSVCVFSENQSHDVNVADTKFWTPEMSNALFHL